MCSVNTLTEIKKETGYSFTNFAEMTKDDFLSGWYEWSLKNWGTKWDVNSSEVNLNMDFGTKEDDEEADIFYSFETAWAPASPVIKAMAKQYPDLEFDFEFDESGMAFAGVERYENGELASSEEASDDDYREFLHNHGMREYYKCAKCGELLEEYEVEENDNKCEHCDSTEIYDTDHTTLLEFDE